MNHSNDTFKALEPEAHVPAYLQKALLSEIDFIRDSMQVVTLFTSQFMDAALQSMTPLDSIPPEQE